MRHDRIRELRTKNKMSQDQLAHEIGVKRSAVSKYESGLIDPPTPTLVKIAKALNAPTAYLLGDVDTPDNRSKTHWAEVVDFLDDVDGITTEAKNRLLACESAWKESFEVYPIGEYIDFLSAITELTYKERRDLLKYAKFLRAQRSTEDHHKDKPTTKT